MVGLPDRTGRCTICKRMKMKCDLSRPACSRCRRVGLRCEYLGLQQGQVFINRSVTNPFVKAADIFSNTDKSNVPNRATPSRARNNKGLKQLVPKSPDPQQPVTLHTPQILNPTDMRLFHHYLIAGYPHFPVRNDNIWLVYITPIAHQCHYLMHALLSLSASHLNKLTTGGFTTMAQSHRISAIKGLNNALHQPVRSAEQGDAILATCYALLMQSWYMDDGLTAFLVLTRSCDSVTRHIQSQAVGSILAQENLDSRIERVQKRLEGVPVFNIECLRSAILSLDALQPHCQQAFEMKLWTTLKECFTSLAQTPLQAYRSQLEIERSLISMETSELEQLINPCNTASQLLLAHLVALHLIMRPIACRERKDYTVTMYGIRMTTWIGQIYSRLKPEYQKAFDWPLLVSQLHSAKRLEDYTVVRTKLAAV